MPQAGFVTATAGALANCAALTPRLAQSVYFLALIGGLIAGFVLPDRAAGARAIASAGPDLALLLRFMVVLKAALVLAAAFAVLWRLQSPITALRFAAYGVLSPVMAAGLGEIWQIAQVALGALLLHGGLVGTMVLLWRDPGLHQRLARTMSRR